MISAETLGSADGGSPLPAPAVLLPAGADSGCVA
jgi:hypothetical protein